MTLGIDIESFSPEKLKELVLGLQAVVQSERIKREMADIKAKSLEMENAVLRDMLARQIVGIVVAPTMIPSDIMGNEEQGGDTGEEEEAKPVTTDGSDKDKFQA